MASRRGRVRKTGARTKEDDFQRLANLLVRTAQAFVAAAYVEPKLTLKHADVLEGFMIAYARERARQDLVETFSMLNMYGPIAGRNTKRTAARKLARARAFCAMLGVRVPLALEEKRD